MPAIGRGHFEVFERQGTGWVLQGWLLNPDQETEAIRLEVSGQEVSRTVPSARGDVAGAFPWIPHAAASGFSFRVDEVEPRLRVDVVATGRGGEIARLRTTLWPDLDQLTQPPPELMKRVTGSPDARFFLADGLRSVTEFLEATRRYRPQGGVRRTLDWGCGCGRLAVHLEREGSVGEVYGADIDAEAIRWCTSTLGTGRFVAVAPMPPMPFEAGFFDLVIGYSVFTHLAAEVQRAWLAEMRRVLARGGLFLASVHGPWAARFALPDANAAPATSPVWRLLTEGFLDLGEDVALRGVAPPEYYRGVFQTAEWTRREWSSFFEILDILPAGTQNYQDLVVLRRV